MTRFVFAVAVLSLSLHACSSDTTSSTTGGDVSTTTPDAAGTGDAVATRCTADSACDDGLACTTDRCTSGSCTHPIDNGACVIDGACVLEGATPTGVTCMSCQPDVSQSAWTTIAGACDDSVACTTDACDNATGCVNTPDDSACDDGLACTDDACAPAAGCGNTLQADACLIDGVCHATDDAKAGAGCMTCQPQLSSSAWTEVPTGCDDGLSCTIDACDPDTGCSNAVDGGFCVIDGACVAEGEETPDNTCLSCQPSVSTTAWSPRTGTCDDGDDCSYEDTCDAGTCVGIPYSCDDGIDCTIDTCWGNGACNNYPADGWCAIAGVCVTAGTINPENECKWCGSDNRFYWTAVEEGTPCTDDGLACTDDYCGGGGTCAHVLSPLVKGCYINEVCYGHNETNPDDPCQVCDADVPYQWVNKADGAVCNQCGRCNAATCEPSADLDYHPCNDSDAATTPGGWCLSGTCSGFTMTTTDTGKNNEGYTHAIEAAGGGVNALYRDCSGTLCSHRGEHYDGAATPTMDQLLGLAVDHPGFAEGYYSSFGTLWTWVPSSGWSTTKGLSPVFAATAPDAVWHTVEERVDTTTYANTVHVIGWQPTTQTPVAMACSFSVLCPSCGWDCVQSTLVGATSEMHDCVGVGGRFANGTWASYLFCNNAESSPTAHRHWYWQPVTSKWVTTDGLVVPFLPGQRLNDVADTPNDYGVLLSGDAGLFRTYAATNQVWNDITPTALGALQAKTNFLRATTFGDKTIVLTVTTKQLLDGMEKHEVGLLWSSATTSVDLLPDDAWTLVPVLNYTCPAGGPCPYEVTSLATTGTAVYLFGAWSPDGVEKDRAMWIWTPPN